MERSLRRTVIIKTKYLPISATTFRTALSLYIAHDGRKHKHNPTLSANKHVLQICRSSLSAAADGLADGSGERRTSPLNGIELKIAQSCRKVVPKSPLPRFQQRCLSTSHRDACERISAIQAVLKGRTMAIRKGNKHQLGLFFLLEACQRNAAGWSTAVWPANAKLPLPHRRSSITRPCCSIERSSAKLLFHALRSSSARHTQNASTRWSTRRRGDHMHDHSRFQRDINDVTGVSLSLSLSLSQKSLTHNIGSASALPIIPKTIGNRKRDYSWGCARGNTTWGNLQIEKHKSVRWAERTPSWFVLFDLLIFSGGVYPPSVTSRTISFSISNSGINLIHFFRWEEGRSSRKLDRFVFAASIPCHAIWQYEYYEETVSKSATFLATESVNSALFKRWETKVQSFGKEKCKTLRQY